jgi:hypothetical protein
MPENKLFPYFKNGILPADLNQILEKHRKFTTAHRTQAKTKPRPSQ